MTHRVGSAATCGRFIAVVMSLIVLASCSGGGSGSSTPPVTTPPPSGGTTNVAAVTVGFGANGSAGGYYNGIWTTVTVCAPGSTTNCQTIPNVLVDTGSIGLRVLSSALGTLSLPQIQDGNGDVLQECIQFASLAYVFGPVAMANVEVGGETASQVPTAAGGTANSGIPIQVIAANPSFAVPASCLSGGVGPDYNTVEALGGNGILGVGNFPQDCGSNCTTGSVAEYYICPNDTCQVPDVPVQDQVWNPVAAFSSSDTNGLLITLPSVAAGGAASVAGSLIFGIGTQSNNALGSAQVYEVDEYGNFPQVTYNGVSYTSPSNGSYIDSGSNAFYFSDPTSLASTGILACADGSGYYCPASTIPFTATVYGANNVSAPVNFSIANAANLISSGNAAFDDLGAASGSGPATDDLDLGLPFFFNRSVFVGIAGANNTYPNGYWAF